MKREIEKKQVVLCILDGWGLTEYTRYSAIAKARTPTYDSLLAECPNARLKASGLDVGLPDGQMGNSEVGHSTIGSGRITFQDLPRISRIVSAGGLRDNRIFMDILAKVKTSAGRLHLMGLMSDGGVHSHIDHLVGFSRVAAEEKVEVLLHCFLDGRDTPQRSALDYLEKLRKALAAFPSVRVATLSGRYYAMDRDKNWDRVSRTYDVLTVGGSGARDPRDIVSESYKNNISDEFLEPMAVGSYEGMKDGDAFIFCNFRADRARELSQALGQKDFNSFERKKIVNFSAMAQFTEYSEEHSSYMATIFPAEKITESLGEVISKKGLRQFRIAETEKYAHVTFFFSGGREEKFPGEERVLVKSPAVATYDLKPEMSCQEVSEKLIEAIGSKQYNFLLVNFANPDMVGHTGNMEATVKAIEALEVQLEKLVGAVRAAGGTLFITADHGNAEKMFDEEKNQPHTAHTTNDVPFIMVKNNSGRMILRKTGSLCDIAPTILDELGIAQPAEFTGKSLLSRDSHH